MRKYSRPRLSIPRTPYETLLIALTGLGVIAVIVITAWGWLILPTTIPTHYGISGTPNAYGGKGGLLFLPVLSICLAALLTFVSRFPHSFNYPWPITAENAPRQYYLARLLIRWLALEIVLMMCILQWLIIQAAQSNSASSILLVVPIVVVVLIVTIVLYMVNASRAR